MDKLSVNITMYPVGELGDCFYLEFSKGDTKSTVLIDSGSFRNGQESIDRMRIIATDLQQQQELQGIHRPFDVMIGTHQHNDHYSNFVHSKDIFKEIGTNQVWLSWLDNPRDTHAAKIARGEREVTKKLRQIGSILQAAALKQEGLKGNVAAARINDILGFYYEQDIVGFGKAPVTPQEGLENLRSLVKEPAYLVPGEIVSLPGFTQEEVKVYVLGPPVDEKLLFDAHPNKGESYEFKLSVALNSADGLLAALSNLESDKDNGQSDSTSVSGTTGKDKSGKIDGTEDEVYEDCFFPFSTDQELKMDKTTDFLNQSYNDPSLEWRKIDYDWLNQAERLALYLDTFTNNSSLVLAFELVEAQKVLLFVGDAQTGNWLSWKDIDWKNNPVSLSKLLNNTVLYKVGHHGSHNATLPASLEQMTHKELVAMIPVDANDGNIDKPSGWKMPAKNLYKKLKEVTNNRILRMDGIYEPDCELGKEPTNANWGPLFKNLSRRKIAGLDSDVVTYKVE
jgi:beta-lactamase superfamily II metal-dependent hydrolase